MSGNGLGYTIQRDEKGELLRFNEAVPLSSQLLLCQRSIPGIEFATTVVEKLNEQAEDYSPLGTITWAKLHPLSGSPRDERDLNRGCRYTGIDLLSEYPEEGSELMAHLNIEVRGDPFVDVRLDGRHSNDPNIQTALYRASLLFSADSVPYSTGRELRSVLDAIVTGERPTIGRKSVGELVYSWDRVVGLYGFVGAIPPNAAAVPVHPPTTSNVTNAYQDATQVMECLAEGERVEDVAYLVNGAFELSALKKEALNPEELARRVEDLYERGLLEGQEDVADLPTRLDAAKDIALNQAGEIISTWRESLPDLSKYLPKPVEG